MAFKHQTYRLAFNEGGFNGNDNHDNIPETSFISPSRNLDLHNNLREKRGGTTKINDTAISGSPKCLGLGVYALSSSSSTIISGHADGKLYTDATTVIKTGMSTTNRYDITNTGATVTICDGATVPQIWTGSGSTRAITTPATDWSGPAQPKFTVVHARGASRRLAAFGVPGFEANWYLSQSEDYEDFSDANVLQFTGEFGDGYGAVAAIDFNQDLFIFGKRRTLILNDQDTSTANWGWVLAPWAGGAAHQKLVIKVDNDVYAMTDDGDIYSIRTVAQTNDYHRASITRPAFIHRYLQTSIDLTKMAEFHVSYEPNIRALLWWVVRNGASTADTCLVFYLDRPSPDQWSIWDGIGLTSGMCATASTQAINSDGTYSVVTGDNEGFLWQINQAETADDGAAYPQVIRTPWLMFKNPRSEKRFINARLIYLLEGNVTLQFRWFVDNSEQTQVTETIIGGGSVFPLLIGTSSFGEASLGSDDIPLGQVGVRIMFEISALNANESIKAAELLIDFEDRGARYL